MDESCHITPHIDVYDNSLPQNATLWVMSILMNNFPCEWFMSRVSRSWNVWIVHVAHEWVMSDSNEACHAWMSHVTLKHKIQICATSRCRKTHQRRDACHIRVSHATYEWVLSHIHESCHRWTSRVIYEWVLSHTDLRDYSVLQDTSRPWVVSQHDINESCHIWTSHVTYTRVVSHMEESCHMWMLHVAYRPTRLLSAAGRANAVAVCHSLQPDKGGTATAGYGQCVAVCCSGAECCKVLRYAILCN